MSVRILSGVLDEMRDYFARLPDIAEQAAVMAINDVAERKGMGVIKGDMRDQVNFPPGYIESRLRVTRRATKGMLEATIRGRDRATSLARFAQGQTPANTRGRGVRVSVGRGQTTVMRRAFLVNLRNGNTGLAIRLKGGESLRNTQGAVQLEGNVWLLYGPSVDQVFRGVVDDRADDLANMVSREFQRQFIRLSNRG